MTKLIAIVSQMASCSNEIIVLDFSKAKMLNPFFLGGLACIMSNFKRLGKRIIINHDINNSIKSYLDTIYFPETFSPEEGNEKDYLKTLERYNHKTFIPIVSFKTGTVDAITVIRENILSAISQLLRNQLKFSERERMPLAYFLGELTDNINEHSKASKGYVFAQYYPNSNYLDLCICDAGQGIYQSYMHNPKFSPKNETEAIQLALSGNSTKDRPEARGFGITTTRNMLVNGLHGKLFLWSGNTTFLQAIDKEAILNIDGYFQGTFIALRLPTIIPGSFDFYKFIEG
ncbi:MAG TPA: hypothetical protein VHA13_06150 [Gammaproteobacteria bacterium]|nr:hypothetical protein [Gammaproteobacteria bacterium]